MKTFLIILGCIIATVAMFLIFSKKQKQKSAKEKEILELSKRFGGNVELAKLMHRMSVTMPPKKSPYEEFHLSPDTPIEIVKFLEKASLFSRYREDVGTIFYVHNEGEKGSHEVCENPNQDKEGRPFVVFTNGYKEIKVKYWGDGRYSTLKDNMFQNDSYLFASIEDLNKAGFF